LRALRCFLTVLSLHSLALACTELPAGTSFWVRLTQPLSSYNAKKDAMVSGVLLEPIRCDGVPVLASKIPVQGRVVSVHRVGLGLIHETASLEVEFSHINPPEHSAIGVRARVETIDNARENVKNGVIHGIRSTETPQGQISSRLKDLPSLHLYPDPFLMGFKLFFPIFPEPEIYLPSGTDIHVSLKEAVALPEDLAPLEPMPRLDNDEEQSIAESLNGLPARTFDRKLREADLIDVAFIGSRQNLEQAFDAAGWRESIPVSKGTVAHQLYAFLAKTDYETAPMSHQLFNGRFPDLTLEKTFDSYEKRDHLRIWELDQTLNGESLWASAAVRETGATLSWKHKGFLHHVASDLDEEQRGILRDLAAADCVASMSMVERPGQEHVMLNATGELLRTDGNIMVVKLKPCSADAHGLAESNPTFKPGSKFTRFLRKEILTVRSDLLRANCIYSAFDLTMITRNAFRRSSAHRAELTSAGFLPSRSQEGPYRQEPSDLGTH
jgi:hypothetical protein